MSIEVTVKSDPKEPLTLEDIKVGEHFLIGEENILYQKVAGGHGCEALRTKTSTSEWCFLNVKTGKVYAHIGKHNIRRVNLEIIAKVQP